MKKLTRLMCVSLIIFLVVTSNVNAQDPTPNPTVTPNPVPTINTTEAGGTTPPTDAGIAYSVDQIKKLLKNIADWLSNPWDTPPEETAECEDCPEDTFKTENFLGYAKQQFSNKFPFDAIEINGGGGTGQCLTLNNSQECQVKEALGSFLSIVKFPIWITFLLSLIKVM